MDFATMLRRFAQWIHRKPGEERTLEDRRVIGAKLVLALFLFFAGLGTFTFYSFHRVHEWGGIKPLLKVEPKDWKVLYGDFGACDSPSNHPKCPADPANPLLWNSHFTRGDKDHFEKVRALTGKAGLWLGAKVVLPHDLDERQFVIGYIHGEYEVYLNGVRVLRSTQTADTVPQSVTLGQDHNWVAIHILRVNSAAYPDIFNRPFGGEGIFSQTSLYALSTLESFSVQARPIAFALAQGVIAILFFFFWWSAKRKQEYFYLSLFLLTQMCIQVRLYDAVYRGWPKSADYRVDLALRILEGLFALTLGLSFSRVRPKILTALMVPGVLCAVAPFFAIHMAAARFLELSQIVALKWVVPAYVVGSLICLVQSLAVILDNFNEREILLVRSRRLIFFSIGLAALAALYLVNARQVTSSFHFVYWYRFGHLGLVLFLAGIVISEYREQEQFVQRAKLSKYITGLKSNESRQIEGTLLRVDLKGSKLMETEAAMRGVGFGYGTVTSSWLAVMCEVIFRAGGEILSESGDEFIAFFDRASFPEPISTLERILSEMLERQRGVEHTLALRTGEMQFRATIVTGKLVVHWKGRIPGYDGDIMAESARVLELEKKIAPASQSTIVLDPLCSEVTPFVKEAYSESVQTDKEGRSRALFWSDLERLVQSEKQAA